MRSNLPHYVEGLAAESGDLSLEIAVAHVQALEEQNEILERQTEVLGKLASTRNEILAEMRDSLHAVELYVNG